MTDFQIRSDNVDVEQIMRQIRSRIREKRGVDYTEEEIKELARVKLEKFLDPTGVRSDLLAQFRRTKAEATLPRTTTSRTRRSSSRICGIVRFMRQDAAADPEAVLQPESADRRAAHPVGAQRAEASAAKSCSTS